MPPTEVQAFRDDDGEVPIQDWLDDIERREPKAYQKCLARILELATKGYEMRRPQADLLRNGIYELRASFSGTHYRMLYFFFGKSCIAVSHGITKEDRVPAKEIDLAISRMKLVRADPLKYTTPFELEEGEC
jgi:phage-related protein